MTKTKSTKRALLLSGLALVLCISMLVGSTYAWFTDSVTSSGNIIKSGTLDVTMEWKDATANGAQQTYKDASEGAIFNYDKWEPGYVEAKNIKIGNAGTLALKYQLNIVANGQVSELADVIDVYYAEGEYTLTDRKMTELTKLGTLTEILAQISTTASGDLLEGESDTVTLALKMQESAGNKYQGLAIGSEFAVQLLATQLTYENDSFDNQYDVQATYLNKDADGAWLINNMDELYFFASQVNSGNSYLGETVKLTADIDLAGYNWIPIGSGDVNGTWIGFNGIFDGQNHTISNVRITKGGGWNGIFGLVGRGTSKVEESISNLTVKNVVIEEANRMSGGVVGQLYGNIENCHVENVTISAIPNWVEKDQSYDNGDKIGGVVGWFGDNGNNHYIRNCSAKNVTLKAYRDVAGIVGYIGTTSTVENCSVDTVSITVDQATNHYGVKDANAGGVVGRIYNDPVTIQNNTEENVNIFEVISDGLYTDGEGAYYVYNAAGMKALNGVISKNVKKVELLADIDMSGTPWTMVDMHADAQGKLESFNGNGWTISNLVIDGEAMFSRIASSEATVTFSNIIFKNVTIDSKKSNTAIITKQTYKNLVLDNVDVDGASISGETKVATLVGTVFNEKDSVITLTVKNCDISDVEITGNPDEPAEERLAGLVAWVADKYSNEAIVLENNTMTKVAINSNSTASEHHALIYLSDKSAANRYSVYHNEDAGVTLTDCTYIRKVADGLYTDLAGDFYVYNATGLQALRTWMGENFNNVMWGKTYNIMADIDASNVTWETMIMAPDGKTFDGIVFNGNGHTITGLTITNNPKAYGTGLFTGASNGSLDTTAPAIFKNITFDNVTVNGGTHHTGVVWGELTGDITLDNVNVINSAVAGDCNVGGLIGRNSECHANIVFKDCSVKNTTVEAKKQRDNAGASAFLGMALHIGNSCSANVVFEGTNVAEGNTLTTATGMQGGGIYTIATWGETTWDTPVVVNDFTNYNSNEKN